MSFDRSHLTGVLQHVLAQTQKRPRIEGVQVEATQDLGYTATVRKGAVESLLHHRGQRLVLTVYVNQGVGSASSSELSLAGAHTLIERAEHHARCAQKDPYAGLPDAALMAHDYPDLDLYHPWEITPDEAITLGISCEAAALEDPRIWGSEGVTVENTRGVYAHANSQGFLGSYAFSQHSMSCMLVAQQAKNAVKERDYAYCMARNASGFPTPEALADQAVQKTVHRLGARTIKTQKVPILLSAELSRGLIGQLIAAISGDAQYQKASFLLDALGQSVMSPHITLEEVPHEAQALGSLPFDAEGVRTQSRQIVVDGVLQHYLLDSYSARKLGMQSTGHAGGISNLYVQSRYPQYALPELLQSMDRGIWVTELMGQGVNRVTGDYSRGAFGYWVEQGKVQYPVHEFTIAGNLKTMLQQIALVGKDRDDRGSIRTGALLIDHMSIAGKS